MWLRHSRQVYLVGWLPELFFCLLCCYLSYAGVDYAVVRDCPLGYTHKKIKAMSHDIAFINHKKMKP